MTSIKGASGQEMVIATEQKGGYRWITAMGADIYKTADLLAALNATANADVKHRADAYQAANRAEAERDALAKTVERVRAVVTRFLDPHGQDAVVAARVAEKIRAALDPEPAFVLPTEAGVKFYAEDSDGDSGVFTTLAGGKEPLYIYDDDQDAVYSGPELASWQNFRLLDGAE